MLPRNIGRIAPGVDERQVSIILLDYIARSFLTIAGKQKRFVHPVMNTYATVVLAAGKGTRMRSTLPKVLHPLAGMPLLGHVLNAVEAIPSSDPLVSYVATTTIHRPVVVLGYEAVQVEAVFGQRCLFSLPEEQIGTGHAVLAACPVIDELDPLP